MLNLWDYSIWDLILQMGILLILILVGNTIRRKIPFFKRSLIPTSVFAGFLALGLKYLLNALDVDLLKESTMEAMTYHALALGYISLGLKTIATGKSKKERMQIIDTGVLTIGGYVIQALVGVLITIILYFTAMPWLFPGSGLLLPMGFGQGTGPALNFGRIYEELGFEGGTAFGLSIAAVGFLFACIGGVLYLNILLKKGLIKKRADENRVLLSVEEIDSPNEIPVGESVDKFTIQLAFVFLAYILTYVFMFGVQQVVEAGFLGDFGKESVLPLVFGFNFLFGTVFAVIVKNVLKSLRKAKVMSRDYSNNFMLNRISGFMFDLMIVAGVCAIEVQALNQLWIPLILVCFIGGFVTFFYIRIVCNRLFPEFAMEQTLMMYGTLTGTASTGMILLREIDPEFKTPCSNLLIWQVLPATALGLPMLLVIGYGPSGYVPGVSNGMTDLWIATGIISAFFVGVLLWQFRSAIFKRRRAA